MSSDHYRLIFESSHVGIVNTDLNGNFLDANPAFCTMLGYTLPELRGTSIGAITHPDDLSANLAKRAEVTAGIVGSEIFEKRYLHRNGSVVWARLVGAPMRDDDGRIVSLFAMVEDITERKLFDERRRQSQRMEAVGQLTGGMAHDFNNLLTVILGNAELLAESLRHDSDSLEFANTIVRSALQGADLTHRLLAFARRQALETRNIDLNQLVDDMGRILRRTLGEDVQLELCLTEDLWLCAADSSQVESAVLNLALNARDAMPEGGRLVIESTNAVLDQMYASQHAELLPGDYVCLAVSDTGTGISPEQLGQVMEPFFTTKPKGKGTGLGLSSVFGFVKQSRGHMAIYSEVGHGTTVKLYLPRSVEGAVESSTRPQAANRLLSGRAEEVILIVEDDAMVREYACHQVRSLGYTIYSAGTATEALELLRAHPETTLLFTDVVMPGEMGGRQLADVACRSYPGLKVLYTSGYTENAVIHNGHLDPGVQLLGKPYRRETLATKLRDVLDG